MRIQNCMLHLHMTQTVLMVHTQLEPLSTLDTKLPMTIQNCMLHLHMTQTVLMVH
jgi:hypothetical protein